MPAVVVSEGLSWQQEGSSANFRNMEWRMMGLPLITSVPTTEYANKQF